MVCMALSGTQPLMFIDLLSQMQQNWEMLKNVDFLCYYIFDLDTSKSFYSDQEFPSASKSKFAKGTLQTNLYDLTSYSWVYKGETMQNVPLYVIFIKNMDPTFHMS